MPRVQCSYRFGKYIVLQSADPCTIRSAEETMRKDCMDFLEKIGAVTIVTKIDESDYSYPATVSWELDPECMPKYDSEGGRKE